MVVDWKIFCNFAAVKRLTGFFGPLMWAAVVAVAGFVAGCSSVKHVPQGEYLLDHVHIVVNGDREVKTEELYNFLRQTPNHKVLGFAKLQLATYSLSGRDSTHWYNRWLRRIGQPPVIYDRDLTEASRNQLWQAMVNRGYTDAVVTVDTVMNPKRRRADVTYNVTTGEPHRVGSIAYNIPDSAVEAIVMADSTLVEADPGDLFDRNRLDGVRTAITQRMRSSGYYSFSRENISFTADTVRGSKDVGLTLNISTPVDSAGRAERMPVYVFRSVTFDATEGGAPMDTAYFRTLAVVYGESQYLKPTALFEKCFILPGDRYNASDLDRTYSALASLPILKFINIDVIPEENAAPADTMLLDAVIHISRIKHHTIILEAEGTNSEGDLGFGVGATYQNRNLWRRSELFQVKFRTAYESLSGNLDGLINKNYSEYAGETSITFPKFVVPFTSRGWRRRMQGSTEFAVSFNYQERPEYTRVIAGFAWRYKWNQRRRDLMRRHTYDLIDINYVRLPRSTFNFIEEIAPDNPLLRYSYEDHFIMRMGYTYSHTNRRIPTVEVNAFAMQPSITTVRASIETAGNLLYGFSKLFGSPEADGAYKVFGIQFSQYVKGEFDYTYARNFNSRNQLAWRVGAGFAFPYGNSSMVPFEKRFYAGGANGVRGWGVRTLGPGAYDSRVDVSDFINQCGDISFIASMEYRAKLFWVFEGALFIDAGNVWTIKNYPNQPDGKFRFKNFYKEIAASYGIGLRMDFTYFLLRLDLGLKAHDPAKGNEPWPIFHPNWKRDANFHFSVGYPF